MATREIWTVEYRSYANRWTITDSIFTSEKAAKRWCMDGDCVVGPYILVLPDATKPKKRVAKKRKAVRK